MLDAMQFIRFFSSNLVLHRSTERFPAIRCRCQLVEKPINDYKWQFTRRHICIGTSLLAIMTLNHGILLLPAQAVDRAADKQEDDGVFGTIKSLLDPNEKTKSGKVLPRAYLRSARVVVKTLRESLNEDRKDLAKFRRSADAAKESIRDYLSNWKGQPTVSKEESYVELEKVFRSLASFYSKVGPSASITDEVKSEILGHLDAAEQFL